MFLIDKRVSTKELSAALEDLDQMLTKQFPDDREARAIAMSYVLYRGIEAMRDEYSEAYARHIGAIR